MQGTALPWEPGTRRTWSPARCGRCCALRQRSTRPRTARTPASSCSTTSSGAPARGKLHRACCSSSRPGPSQSALHQHRQLRVRGPHRERAERRERAAAGPPRPVRLRQRRHRCTLRLRRHGQSRPLLMCRDACRSLMWRSMPAAPVCALPPVSWACRWCWLRRQRSDGRGSARLSADGAARSGQRTQQR